jgi:uncharacterized protein (UPF0333 family)
MKTQWVAVLLLVVVVALVLTFAPSAKKVSEEDAKKFVLEDLREKYPQADEASILSSVLQTGNDSQQYYYLKAKVVKNAKTPCPERIHLYYNFPLQNFVTQPPEYITRGCKVCINEPECLLAFEEDAVIASHTYAGAEQVADYLKAYPDAQPGVSSLEGKWEVGWDSQNAAYYYKVLLSKSGNSVESVERVEKEG